jgi:hypothetical protein
VQRCVCHDAKGKGMTVINNQQNGWSKIQDSSRGGRGSASSCRRAVRTGGRTAFYRLLSPFPAFSRFAPRKFFCEKEMAMARESKRCERFAGPESCVKAQNGRFSGNAVLYAEMSGNEGAGKRTQGKQSACVRLCPRISRNIVFSKGVLRIARWPGDI